MLSSNKLRIKSAFMSIMALLFVNSAFSAAELNKAAPLFETQDHLGQAFKLENQKGKWTVLYFYPKADTPGCTKQACAFRDSIKQITSLNADIYGISTDNVQDQAIFHKKHNLNFTLLADADGKVTEMYGAKMPMLKMSKRWTYIIDPDLKVRAINKDVDPAKDAESVAKTIKTLQAQPSPQIR